jgi:DNA-binding beta-propeller fold protein YncE
MRKVFSILLAGILLVGILLVGCNSGSGGGNSNVPKPTVTLLSPTESFVEPKITIKVQFNESVESVNESNVTLIVIESNESANSIESITLGNNNIYTIIPANGILESGKSYILTFESGILGAGGSLTPESFTFTTQKGVLAYIESVPTGNLPYGITISPDGKNAYVTNQFVNNVFIYKIQ